MILPQAIIHKRILTVIGITDAPDRRDSARVEESLGVPNRCELRSGVGVMYHTGHVLAASCAGVERHFERVQG